MFYKMWRQEFSLKSFTLEHDPPEDFTRCMWQKEERVKPIWIAYRAILGTYFIASFFYTLFPIEHENPEEHAKKYLIFLTHWTYVVEALQFEFALIIVAMRYNLEDKKSSMPMDQMPWFYKLYWVLYTIALPGALTVSIIFWGTIYNPEMFPVNAANLMEHAFNSILMLIDFILVGHPIRALHFYWPFCYAVFYALFSLVYQLSGGTGVKGMVPIYKILDWRDPKAALLTCLFSVVFLIFLHFIFSLLHMFKAWIKKKHSSTE